MSRSTRFDGEIAALAPDRRPVGRPTADCPTIDGSGPRGGRLAPGVGGPYLRVLGNTIHRIFIDLFTILMGFLNFFPERQKTRVVTSRFVYVPQLGAI